MRWKNNLTWILYVLIALFLGWYVVGVAKVQQAGDIAEYYGVTESLKNHGGVRLTEQDRSNLEQVLHPAYFEMTGYYVEGREGGRYPVHFWAYSVLALPFRLILELFGADGRRALFLVNWASIILAVGYVMKTYLKNAFYRVGLLVAVFTGALLSFLVWPGPDLWYLSLLMVATFAFFGRNYWQAALLVAIASWHSQPLMVLAGGLIGYALYRALRFKKGKRTYVALDGGRVFAAGLVGLVALVPYFYNLYAFGVLTPWTKLADGWTLINGFGLHNASLFKFWEQWFDLNIGLFWYAPLVFLLALLGVWRLRKYDGRMVYFIGLSLLTAFFYQTNPAWHYGTVGYGPGRHGVYLLPILLFFGVRALKPKVSGLLLILGIGITQIAGMSLNGYLEPDFTRTLYHSPYAKYVLTRWPEIYNPTPEIFVDRTNHTDEGYPTSAVFRVDGRCVKAYVLITDEQWLLDECANMPEGDGGLVDNPYMRLANYERTVLSREVTYWPEPDACSEWFIKTKEQPFECMRSEAEFLRLTGLDDWSRLATVAAFPYPGIWSVTEGDPVELMIPPGYIVTHEALEGTYVTYPVQ